MLSIAVGCPSRSQQRSRLSAATPTSTRRPLGLSGSASAPNSVKTDCAVDAPSSVGQLQPSPASGVRTALAGLQTLAGVRWSTGAGHVLTSAWVCYGVGYRRPGSRARSNGTYFSRFTSDKKSRTPSAAPDGTSGRVSGTGSSCERFRVPRG